MTNDTKRPAGWPKAVLRFSGYCSLAGCQSSVFSMVGGGAGEGTGVSASSETTLATIR